jgi:aspartate aminotransferase
VSVELSQFARSLSVETAFTVLAVAKSLKAAGKDVVELEIGDSPFDSTASAKSAGVQAIQNNQSHYCPSPGIPEFREAAARFVKREFGIPAEAKNIVAGPGAKVFEQFFCEAFLDPGDGVLVFGPYFPTYLPNIERRGARAVVRPLRQSNQFRPEIAEIERFLAEDRAPRAIFLNSPHNPTGGVAIVDDLK